MDQQAPQSVSAKASINAGRLAGIERTARLWSGLVLFTFVLTHFLNHATGIFGIAVMEEVQVWRVSVWRSWPGTILLYGAASIHVLLALKRIVERRTWRMPLRDALQICLGLAIPFLLYQHAIGTRWVSEVANVQDVYGATLQHLWPNRGWMQTALTLVVWGHAMIGLEYYLRTKTWWPRWRQAFLLFAVIVPLAALAGYVSAGREAVIAAHPGARWTADQVAAFDTATRFAYNVLIAFGLALIGVLGVRALMRRFGRRITMKYVGHGNVMLPRGSTLLEASRTKGIPHPSLCGGRARCSTCRVLILEGGEALASPNATEKALLNRISAPPNVRLACQIQPTAPLKVQILMPASAGNVSIGQVPDDAYEAGTEVTATVLFVDMRAFTVLSKTQFPYDLVALLNRFLSEIQQSIDAHGGQATMYLSDGLMAVFGLNGGSRHGSRSALRAARDMLRSIEAMNAEFQAALAMPLRIGIGIHTGPLIMARIGDEQRGFYNTALGETVTIASRLEAATKRELSDCLASQATLKAAGRGYNPGMRREINISGLSEPIVAYAIDIKANESDIEDQDPDSPDGAEPATQPVAAS
jgi:adenylate cyclase